MRKLIFLLADHPALTIGLCLLAAFVLLNLLAYRHAWAMTHFVAADRGARRSDDWRERSEPLSLFERVQLAIKGVAVERPADEERSESVELPRHVHDYPGGEGRLTAWHIPHPRPAGLVVLFHGYAADKGRLLPEARGFHDLGYACFLVDFRGSGGSDGQRTSIGYHEADDVARSVTYARQQWPNQPLILFGQSMGAAAVLRALSQHTIAADAVVLECPFDRLLSTVEARFAATGLPAFPAAPLLVFWGGAQHGFNGFSHNPVEYARQVTCPALLLHGTCDNRVSCRQIESIYHNLAGSKQLHFFEDLGHQSYAASQPEQWKRWVAHFLKTRVSMA
jgi:alpha-beta hydrolase superfamily lysophospholipase